MTDLVLIVAIVALIAVMRLYVAGCRRIGEPDERLVALPWPLALPLGAGAADWIGLAVAIALIAYLLAALLRPERF